MEVGKDEGDEGGHADAECETEEKPGADFFPGDAEERAPIDFTEGQGTDDHGCGLAAGVSARSNDHGQEEREHEGLFEGFRETEHDVA